MVHLSKLYRKIHDGENTVSDMELDNFRNRCKGKIFIELKKVIPNGGVSITEASCGQIKKEYKEEIDAIQQPPYYIWCRVEVIAFGDFGDLDVSKYMRKANGMLEPEYIEEKA